MANTVPDIIAALVTLEQGITGVREAYAYTPESVNALPCFVNYPVAGTLGERVWTPSKTTDSHQIACELFVARGVLPQAEAMVRPFVELFRAALAANPTLSGACATCIGEPVTYSYGSMQFGPDWFLGIRFVVTVTVFR